MKPWTVPGQEPGERERPGADKEGEQRPRSESESEMKSGIEAEMKIEAEIENKIETRITGIEKKTEGPGIYLELADVLDVLEQALEQRTPLSLVRIGDGENLVLAQDTVWPLRRVLAERWAVKANRGQKGLTLPNLRLRDEVAEAVRRADVVGILPEDDDTIKAPADLKRALTDRVFAHHRLNPPVACHACVNRELAVTPRFWELLRGRRVLIVTALAEELRALLAAEPYGLDVAGTYVFTGNAQMEEALAFIEAAAEDFDVALFSCGVNAVVLAQQTAERTGRVAIDFGKAIRILLYGKPN